MRSRAHRTGVAAAAVAASTAAVLSLGSPASAASAEWSSAGGGPDNTYWNEDETTITADTVGSLEKKFSIDAPASGAQEPVVAEGKIFLPYEGGVAAYSTDGGKQLWKHDVAAATTPEVAWSDDNLYLSASELGRPSSLTALDAAGNVRWTRTDGDVDFGSLVAADGRVVVSGTNRGYSTQKVLAFAANGTPVWRKNGHTVADHSDAVDDAGQVFLRPWDGTQQATRTTAVALRTGKPRWTIDRAIQPRAVAGEGTLVGMEDNGVITHRQLSVSSADGSANWDVPTSYAAAAKTVAVDDRHSYLAERHAEALTARDLETGETAWTVPIARDADLGSPVVAGGLVYLTSLYAPDRTLTAYDAGTGERMWSRDLTGNAPTHPVIVNGWLYLVQDGQLDAYAPAS